jgi:hypothetical protein
MKMGKLFTLLIIFLPFHLSFCSRFAGSPCENQKGSHLKGDSSRKVAIVAFQAFSTENPKNSSRKLTSEK